MFLSNGPGDPEPCDYAIDGHPRRWSTRGVPTFGICLGHQLLGLASGAQTIKMKFGHHGANHPVHGPRHRPRADHQPEPRLRRRRGDRCRRTLRVTHVSLFDGSLQGIARTDRPAFCFQGHPEASPGPHDIAYLFDRFVELMEKQPLMRQSRDLAIPYMPKRTDIESILIIGAGPIIIGQACEFDYSGAQACKALREEGYRVILVNSQPGDDHDRPGDGRRHLHRADHLADGRRRSSSASGPTRCCRRWAARRR